MTLIQVILKMSTIIFMALAQKLIYADKGNITYNYITTHDLPHVQYLV